FDTRPPMLDRTDFASWQQCIRLYCRGKENGVNILNSIDVGPFQMGTFREKLAEGNQGALQLGPERARVYSDLSPEDKDRESQLYDDFEHFRQNKGGTIHDYYVWFTKLINDMRNIKMTMYRIQLNSKFVNNMLLEWGRFVIAVKLNRGLRDSNYDQLYAYLKQHEAHANENKIIAMRFRVVRSAMAYTRGQKGLCLDSIRHKLREWSACHSGSSEQNWECKSRSSKEIKCYNCNDIGHIARNRTQPKHLPNSEYFKDKMLLMQAQENGVTLDEEQLLFIAGGQDNAVDEDVDEQPVQDLALTVDNLF
ncbi:retrovirus-related pol polyprotein from transposon TNT 1-94, partial [Tanacetum coccineum]